jgi:hypothetical protein
MKKTSIVILAIFLGCSGGALASDLPANLIGVESNAFYGGQRIHQQERELSKRNAYIHGVRDGLSADDDHSQKFEKSTSLELVGNQIYFRYAYDNKYVYMGRVRNVGSRTYSFVEFHVELRDSIGNTLGSDYTYLFGTNLTLTSTDMETGTCLRPGETGFFSFYVDTPSNTDGIYYSFEASTYSTATPDANLIMWQGPRASEDYAGNVDLSGVVKNTGNAALKFGMVACAASAANNEMLDAFFTFIDGESIDGSSSGLRVGNTAPFDISILFAAYSEFRSSECRISWDDYGENQPPPVGGDCVQDLNGGVVCLRDGRFELTAEWTDFSDPAVTRPLIWTPVEDINAMGGFQNNPTGIQVVMRVADGCDNTGTWWVWLGGFTSAGWDIRVLDTVTGRERTFKRVRRSGDLPTTMRDTTTFSCY